MLLLELHCRQRLALHCVEHSFLEAHGLFLLQILQIEFLHGKPLKQYVLDHAVNGIWVMEEEGKMLALDVNSDEPIVEYILR